MRFFEKFFGSVSKTNEENNYALATLEYATSPEIKKSKAMVYNNRRFSFEAESRYTPPAKDYAKVLEIRTDKAKDVTNFELAGLQDSKIRVTVYKSRSSKNYRSIIRG